MTKVVFAALLLTAISCHAEEQVVNNGAWVSGFWQVTDDESKDSSLGEIVEFRRDRSVVLWDSSCNSQNAPEELSYRIDHGDVYVTNHLSGKDYASFSLRPSQDNERLVLIWPDSGTSATLTRMPGNGCPEEERDPPLDRSSGLDLTGIAKQYNVPYCEVSVPLTPRELLRVAERYGDTHTENRPEWAEMVRDIRAGDQLRQVICLKAGEHGMAAGDVFYGLFRDGKMVAEMHTVIIN